MITESKLKECSVAELQALLNFCESEIARRGELACKRAKWIDLLYQAYADDRFAEYTRVGDTIVMAVFRRGHGLSMASAHPVKNDVFCLTTGIAVAYAKATGVKVPDYI